MGVIKLLKHFWLLLPQETYQKFKKFGPDFIKNWYFVSKAVLVINSF